MKFYDTDDNENMNGKEEGWVKTQDPVWFDGERMISANGNDDE
jgi:hypothetical protein